MNSRHITKILDNARFSDLSVEQASEINVHILDCQECRAAFRSAQVTSILLRENSNAEKIVATPFFQAKVLNAWREKQIVNNKVGVFWRWWQASAALVSMMFLVVISLITTTIVGSHYRNAVSRNTDSDAALYSTETVILNEKPSRNLTTEQVYEVLDDNN